MSVIVTGSIATDYLMKYPGHFREHILPDQEKLSVSFLVEEKTMSRGGVGPNIAYTLALLGQRPRLMGAAGQDFGDYRAWLEAQGVDTSLTVAFADEFTATFTVITDLDQNQIAGFHAGAMSRARELSFRGLDPGEIDLVIISPNVPIGMLNSAAYFNMPTGSLGEMMTRSISAPSSARKLSSRARLIAPAWKPAIWL